MPSLSREQKVLTQNLVCTLWHSHSSENWLCLLFAVNQKQASAADKAGFLSWKRHPPKIWVLVLVPHRWAADFVQLTCRDLYKLGLHIPVWSISLSCALAFTHYNHSCGLAGKESACNVGGPGFDPWVGKISCRRESLPTPVLRPGECHGLYSPCRHTVGHNWATFTFFHH